MNAKTLFAALAATSMLTVFGDSFTNAVNFELYHNIGDKLTNGNDDEGKVSDIHNAYFLYQGDEDNSYITNNLGSYTGTAPKDGVQNQSLYVDTGSGTLFRGVNNLYDASTLGKTFDLSSDGDLFVDTLVQFTVTEDEEPQTESTDKLAIWLSTNNTLYVKAGYLNKEGESPISGENDTVYALSGLVEPGTWYRLTVQATYGIGGTSSYPGFKIYIDGEAVHATTATANAEAEGIDASKMQDKSGNWVVFPSLKNTSLLQAVGFKGTGAVDDLVITDTAPEFALPASFDFTLTWTENVTSIKYTLDGVETTTNVTGAGEMTLNGSSIKILTNDVATTEGTWAWTTTRSAAGSISTSEEYGTDEETFEDYVIGYTYAITGSGAIIDLTYTGLTPTVEDWEPDSSTIAPNKSAAEQYHSLEGTALATANAKKLTDWAKGNSVSLSDVASAVADSTIAKAFMLNCANTAEAVADAEEDFKEDITITMVDGVPQVSYSGTYNVTPQMKGSNDITDSNRWTNVSGASTDYKFYKFVLSL